MIRTDRNTITTAQIDLVVALVAQLRPDWGIPGVRKAVRVAEAQITKDPVRLSIAAIRAASTPTNLTPAIIGMQGPHWSTMTEQVTLPTTAARRCLCGDKAHGPDVPCRPRASEIVPPGDLRARIAASRRESG